MVFFSLSLCYDFAVWKSMNVTINYNSLLELVLRFPKCWEFHLYWILTSSKVQLCCEVSVFTCLLEFGT
ncbi:hypothetical protein OIU76_013257 [Salix suchowensis]|nr:hypothetical protein OIU76_013257 [Salix suchowensis]